ncbi:MULTISPECIES: hypothetical protein [Novosphingobium]|uniref:hypothetical protein n=1 Tax=Novosphingobium TaxID=165696 RepID=UPI000D4F9816|nr:MULTISPECIES: hypothetical protein [Novosphingobium]PTR07859.1 hypothetical protein C8K11_11370 [Novosphingobium sp. GV055]PUB00672.1 hypothetical protein C8K12_11370 [Novosphingobium sp. GV061]PUB16081.1 hypothetical protein C8K14_11370 [Novosphingobium sp. GV079]PUB39546.1 hypothetical protein C8K10_11370 [Novosphingobium sp. GV027]WQD93785.1 hypothetical protein U0041_04080 [Novosphingobium capsulatum]
MSMKECLLPLVEQGKITREQADRARELYDELAENFGRQMGPEAAGAMATDAALKGLEYDLARRKMLAAVTIRTRQRIEAEMAGYRGGNGDGPINPNAGPAFLGGDEYASYSSVEGRWRAVRGRAHGRIDQILADHSSNLKGDVRNRAQLEDIVREAFGEDSGNANARELAQAWGTGTEELRQRYNAAGGDIGKLEGWGLPQSHNARAVRAAGYEAWRDFIVPKLDRLKMVDRRTGLPFTDASFEAALRDVFETIRSEGWNDRNPGGMGASSLANRRSDARFLVFKNADDWMRYNETFGAGSAFDAMMGHIDGMSRDIAMLEVLGPNPSNTVEWIKDTIVRSAELDPAPNSKAVDATRSPLANMDRMWRELQGLNNRAENRSVATFFSSFRSIQTAAKLGSAIISAITDIAFQDSARAINGMSSVRMIGQYYRLMKPGAEADHRLAVRLGLIAEEWSNRTAAQSRMLNEELSNEVSRRLAEGALRVQGLARWTQAGRWAFGMELLGLLTDERGKAFAELDPVINRRMQRYGLSAEDWDAIRATPLETDHRGVEWINPNNVANRALGDRLLEWIAQEVDHAVPVPDLRTRAQFHSLAPKGNLLGEAVRSAFLFKSFGASIALMQSRRIMAQGWAGGARYTARLFTTTMIMGGLTLLAKDLLNGKDPRRMFDKPQLYDEATGEFKPKLGFWAQASLQGGGWGIFGDFLNSASDRNGNGLGTTALGPVWATGQDAVNVLTAKHKAKQAVKVARGMLPGGSLWYLRLAFDRMVTDEINKAVDPGYAQSNARMAKFAKDQGTQFYWAPGEKLPGRAPDFSNAVAPEPAP